MSRCCFQVKKFPNLDLERTCIELNKPFSSATISLAPSLWFTKKLPIVGVEFFLVI